MTNDDRIAAAIETIVRYGGIGGEHHKAWALDQALRILTGDKYANVVADACAGDDGPQTYGWDVGIAP